MLLNLKVMQVLAALTVMLSVCSAEAVTTWPNQFHVGVRIPDLTGVTQFTGNYYYDWNAKQASLVLSDANTDRRTHIIVNQTFAYVMELATGKCSKINASTVPFLPLLQPDFVSAKGFQKLNQEYHFYTPRTGSPTHFLTVHWQLKGQSGNTVMNYYQNMHSHSPFRLEYAIDAQFEFPQLFAFEPDFTAGFDDIQADLKWLFTVPSQCLTENDSQPAVALLHQLKGHLVSSHKAKTTASQAPPIATPWPQQFYTTQTFDHGMFDLPTLQDNTTLDVKISGTYYYDWPGNREASTWIDVTTQSLYRTVIADGSFKAIWSSNNRCVIPPTGITGPLKPAWVQNLAYTDDWFLLRGKPGTYVRARHYLWDAFGAGPDNSFNYWESVAWNTPMRFVGPTLEFPPWQTSASEYNSFTIGLDGVDTKTVFSYPSGCIGLTEEQVPASWKRILAARMSSPVPVPLYLPFHDLDASIFASAERAEDL